jgi:hypothetical protein
MLPGLPAVHGTVAVATPVKVEVAVAPEVSRV